MAAAATSTAPATTATTTILITGANSGIGFGLVQHYAKLPHTRVIATARQPQSAAELQALIAANKRVSVVPLDASDSKSVAALPAALAALQPPVTALDVLINNAGIVSGVKGHDGFAPIELDAVDSWMAVYRTNVVGAWDVTNTLLPLIRKSQSAAPKLVHTSSLGGQFAFSLDGPMAGYAVAYRASKAALNLLAVMQSRHFNAPHIAAAAAPADAKLQAAAAAAPRVITVLALHPGTVETPILAQTSVKPPGLKTVAESADGIAKILAAAKVDPKARFFDASEQKELSW